MKNKKESAQRKPLTKPGNTKKMTMEEQRESIKKHGTNSDVKGK